MSITGSGSYPNTGGQIGPREQEATAATVMQHMMLGIVKDSIEISFTLLNRDNLWKYSSRESQPTLSHPLEMGRTSELDRAEDKSWKEFFDNLIKNLPSEVQARLIREREKAREERNDSYESLNDFLTTHAKALSRLDSASKPDDTTSVTYRNALLNSAVTTIAAQNLGLVGKTFFKHANEFLDAVGSNYVHHDKLSNNLQQTQVELTRMELLMGRENGIEHE